MKPTPSYRGIEIKLDPDPRLYAANKFCKSAEEYAAIMRAEFPGMKVEVAYDRASASMNFHDNHNAYEEILEWDRSMYSCEEEND